MPFDKANKAAGEHLMLGATLEELRAAVPDLRALTPDSALAELVDERIAVLLKQADESREGMDPAR
jgi:hypothetical protein